MIYVIFTSSVNFCALHYFEDNSNEGYVKEGPAVSDQPSAALRGGAEHTRAGVVRARAFMLIFAAPALIPAPFIC